MTPLPEPASILLRSDWDTVRYFTKEQLQAYGAARFNEALELAAHEIKQLKDALACDSALLKARTKCLYEAFAEIHTLRDRLPDEEKPDAILD